MVDQTDSTAPYVFLSYASAERDHALAVRAALQQAGIAVWLDRHAIAGGSAWSTAIVRGIKACTAFLVLGSERAFASPNVQRELNLAVEENRPLLPLLLEPVTAPDDVRYALAGRQWVIIADRAMDAWLAEVLQALAGFGIGPSTPAAAAPEPVAVHLPTPLTSFIGREQELVEVTALLETTRLLTLTGPGGTGKTRLAIAVAARVAPAYSDGVWFLDLSGVVDPAGVLPAIAVLLEVRQSEGYSLAVSLAAYLRRKRLLLVLDNVEQVVAAAMALYDLLAEAPGLALLVTSRVLLHLESEREYAVPPLPLPATAGLAGPEQLSASPAVQLFVQRAQGVRAGFALTGENAAAVAAICVRLDGLPLAIELAAARVKLLPPVHLLARLEQRLAFLTGGERNRPTRQQTLRNTIQWSWDLLAPAEQVLFRRLGVFAGGFTLAAAEAVCNLNGEVDVLEGLAALVDQSLVRQSEVSGEPRFMMLATLQEFALEQLEGAGEREALRRRHTEHYCTLAEAACTAWWSYGRTQQDLLRPLDPERDNLLIALAWTVAEQDAELGLRLGGAVGAWFYFRGPGEGLHWLERLLRLPGAAAPGIARGRAQFGVAACSVQRGEYQTAVTYYEAAAASWREAEDLPFLSIALGCLSGFLLGTEADRAQAIAGEALSLARAVGSAHQIAFVEQTVGLSLLWHAGNGLAARAHLEEALRLSRSLDADWLTSASLNSLSTLAAVEGQREEARGHMLEGLPLAEAVGDRMGITIIHMQLAQLAATAGDQDEAAARWRRALRWAEELGSASAMALCLTGIAGLLRDPQQAVQVVRLLAASNWLRQAGEQHPFLGPQFQAAFGQALSTTQATLPPEAFAQAWAAGQALTLNQAVDLALSELASLPPSGDIAPAAGA